MDGGWGQAQQHADGGVQKAVPAENHTGGLWRHVHQIVQSGFAPTWWSVRKQVHTCIPTDLQPCRTLFVWGLWSLPYCMTTTHPALGLRCLQAKDKAQRAWRKIPAVARMLSLCKSVREAEDNMWCSFLEVRPTAPLALVCGHA